MKTPPFARVPAFLLAAAVLPGCANHQTASRPPRDSGQQVVYTGSHVPQPRNKVTAAPLSANTPAESVSRNPGSLVPTEPVVGATDNARPTDDTRP